MYTHASCWTAMHAWLRVCASKTMHRVSVHLRVLRISRFLKQPKSTQLTHGSVQIALQPLSALRYHLLVVLVKSRHLRLRWHGN